MSVKADLDTAKNIHLFIDLFYQQVLQDALLAPIFLDVAKINLAQHKQHIYAYWQKLLLKDPSYQRNTMDIHRQLNGKQRLQPQAYKQWLTLFKQAALENFAGDYTNKAVKIAENIAANMEDRLYHERQPQMRRLN